MNGTPATRAGRLATAAHGILTRTDSPGVAQRAAALALAIRIGNAGLAYVAQVVLARLMGQFEYGVFAYTWVWFLVFAAISTLGFGDSPLRYIAQLRERGEEDHLRGFLRFATAIILASSVGIALLVLAVLPLAGAWIGSAYGVPMALMAICIPFACLQALLEAIGRCYGWTLPALLPVYILRHGLLLVFMVAAVSLDFEASAVTALVCLVLTLAVSLGYQALDIMLRLRRVLPGGPHAYRPKEWVHGSLPFAVIYAFQHLSSFADVLILSFFVSPTEIAVYFAATRVIQVVNLVPYAATVGTAHLFSAAHTRDDHDELQRLCRYVSVMTFTIAAAAVAVILVAGEWLLAMFGSGFEAGYPALAILAVGVLARVAAGPAEDILNMTGHSRLSASTYVWTVLANVALAALLIVPFGISGAAIATAAALAARGFWLSAILRRRLGVHPSILAAFMSAERLWGRRSEAQSPAE